MSDRGAGRRILDSLHGFGLLYAILVVALPALIVIVFTPQLDSVYLARFVAPGLQREFGFRVEYRAVVISGDPMTLPVVTHVATGSYFDKLAVRPGDVIYCNHHGEGDFWGSLKVAQEGYRTHIKLVPAASLEQGCGAYRWIDIRLEDLR